MEFCCGLLLVVVVVTVLGHGIWVLVAAILKQLTNSSDAPQVHRRRRWCPGCECELRPSDRECPTCGLDQDSRRAAQLEHARHAIREVAALVERGELDAEAADRVAAKLRDRVRALTHGPAAAQPVAAPALARPLDTIPPLEAIPEAIPEATPYDAPPPISADESIFDATVAPEPAPPRRGAFAGFMEERNIFWGELVGGLLIVGCSIALVLSLWRSLEELPYFPFLLAAGITAALFGAGQYTLHHWKLAASSRGLLVIALLLAPLNLLLLAAPGAATAGGLLDLAVKLAALAAFVGMVRAAGRDLIGTDLLPGPIDRRWLLALAVVGAPATQWLPDAGWPPLPAWLPLACHAAACAAVLAGLTWYRREGTPEPFGERTASAVLVFAGVSLFALLAAWGLFLTHAVDVPLAVRGLAVPLVIAAVPVLEAGLLVQRRLVAGHAGLTATATGVAVGAAGLLAVGVTLAWPDPLRLTLAAAVAGAVFTRLAWRDAKPWFLAGAVPSLSLACALAVHGIAGQWAAPDGRAPADWLWHLLGSSASGVTLAGFALLLAAVGELAAGRGRRALGGGYALGAAAAGAVGLMLVTGHGPEEPWPAAGAHLACAVGLLAGNVRWKRRAAALAGVWLALVATLWTLQAARPVEPGSWGFAVALEALALAAAALALTPRAAKLGPAGVVFGQLRLACRDVAAAAAVLAVALVLPALVNHPGNGWLHAGTFLVLAPTGLLLARVFVLPAFTWAGSAAAFVGLALLGYFTAELRPGSAALLPALLTHATLAIALGEVFRGRPARARLFSNPLRATARVTTGLAALLLLLPAAGQAPAWAGYAVWLAALWFAAVRLWREAGAFSAGQAALAAAAVLAALGWVERQDWWTTTTLGARDPRALQAFGLALALLGMGWVAARRLARPSERLRDLWLRDPFALDRFIIGGVVIAQLFLLAAANEPAVRAELTPLGRVPLPAPAELAHAFDAEGWVLLALLAAVLVAALRVRTDDEPDGGPELIGLLVLLLTVPVLWAGTFAPELAAASALRWGLAAAFAVGSGAVFLREPLGDLAARAGFRVRATPAAKWLCYVTLAAAAAVVVVQTGNVAALGMNRLTPSVPGAETIFARLGWTASHVVPMALVVLALAGTAARERLAGYAFAAGLLFTATLTGGYALAVVTGGGTLGEVEHLRLAMLVAGGLAVAAALWIAGERRVPGGVLLDLQAGAALFGVGLIALVPLMHLVVFPGRVLHPAFAELGGFGWPLLALATWACFNRAGRSVSELREHVVGFAAMACGMLAACAVQPLDEPGAWLSFHTLAAAWAAVGLGLAAALFRAPLLSRGWWLGVVAAALVILALRGPAPGLGHWVGPVALAGYALLVAAVAVRLARGEEEKDRWNRLLAAEGVVAGVAVLLAALAAVEHDPLLERLGGPLAVALLAVAAGSLAWKAPAADHLRLAAVVLAAGAVSLVGWAAPESDEPAVWLRRNGWAFAALVAAAAACVTVRLPSAAWTAAARRAGGGLAAAALAALAVVLLQQVPAFDPVTRRTPLGLPAVLADLAAIGVLVALALGAALRPAADPLALPERRRGAYVYLAEVLVVLFFIHVRLNLPELFVGALARYWTFVVMLLAFAGVGAAEVFERRGLAVLARPLRHTGVLLPLIPLLAFWAKPPGAVLAFADGTAPGLRPLLGYLERLPQHFDSYAGLWTLAGLLYGLIALQRRSFGWALLAALAANAGLWALLAHNGVPATVHPQVWVIPLALIVLVSEHVNRRQLRPDLSNGLRYVGIGMLYVASAADMFIAGVGESLWLPVLLAVFCVAGILGGIMLRVRAFLFLGAGFLLLDVFAMIWHAAVDRAQTWVWYASGIVLGAAILALFAVFEKRKNEVRGVVEELKRWD